MKLKTARGKIKIFRKKKIEYIQVVTSLPHGEETTALFRILRSPCVCCGGVGKVDGISSTKSCSWCRDTDSVIVLRNDKREVKI